jgi:hypothetical protein
MADDTRENLQNGVALASAGSEEPPRKPPKRVILGKDGKP